MSNVSVVTIKKAAKKTSLPSEQPPTISQEESDLLKDTVFFDIVMNTKSKFNSNEYKTILSIISPTLSSKLMALEPQKAKALIKDFLKLNPEQIQYLENMPDEVSSLNHVLMSYMKSFVKSVKEKGVHESLDTYVDFFFLMEEVFKTLPLCFAFSLTDYASSVK